MINSSMVKTAIREAQKSNFHHRHGCVIFNGARVINVGFNEIRYCSKLNKKYRKWINSFHAEQKTILFAQAPVKRCSLLIIRINKNNQLVNSKPCKMCQSLIADVGITKVYYSDKLGQIQMLRLVQV
jgi:deoxycytidylate deaminase